LAPFQRTNKFHCSIGEWWVSLSSEFKLQLALSRRMNMRNKLKLEL